MEGKVDDNLSLQKKGAAARASGKSFLDNPYYRAEAMPRQTGEDVASWEAKASAWGLGWEIENAMRRVNALVEARYEHD